MSLLCKEENETPGWTQLKLPGQAPSPRCGHTVTSGGHYVITLAVFLVISFHTLILMLSLLVLFLTSILKVFSSSFINLTAKILSLQLLLFGGHGTGGWLSRYDIYYNDCTILDRS